MRILIDSNVILELVLQREQVDVANRLVGMLHEGKHEMLMTSGGFYGLVYTIDKYLRQVMKLQNPERINTLRSIMIQILHMFDVIGQDKQTFLKGIGDINFNDIEDSCQHQAAVESECDCLVTFNVKDYQGVTSLLVLSPQEFITKFLTQ
jgi:predicted nucleic acid-binding protein